MPRKKNQSQNVTNVGKDSRETMTQNSDVELKWRDTALKDLQSMFSGSIDPEVVQLVLSESNYNVNDAIEKLFVLSGIDQDQQEDRKPYDSDHSSSTLSTTLGDSELSRQKIPSHQNVTNTSSNESEHVMNPHTGTLTMSKQSSLGNCLTHGSSFAKASENQSGSSPFLYKTDCAQNQAKVPRIMPPSFTAPYVQVETDSKLRTNTGNSSPGVMSSGLPDFPDNVSQQFKALQMQTKVSSNVEGSIPHESSKHREVLYNPNGPPISQNGPPTGCFEIGKPLNRNQHGHIQEPKRTLESFLKLLSSQNTSSEDWKKVSHSSTEQQQLDSELSKKKLHSLNMATTAAHRSNNKESMPYNKRTSNSGSSFTNSQTYTTSNLSQNVHKTLPTHDLRKPQFQPTVNNAQQLSNRGILNSVPRESFIPPPTIQRQFQPPAPPQRYGQVIPGSLSQPRFGFLPIAQSPQQHLPQRPVPRGQIPHQYPQGTFPYQPLFFFGRGAHPSAAVRPARPASATCIPFIPTIHQKLLILIRGLPGSGKSTLAQKLKGAQGVVLSTDNFFYRNQKYEFDVNLLGEAHEWNQKQAKSALEKLISPVIIDNTNTQCWEMKPYVSMGLRHGYHIKFIEPDTTWKWNAKELCRRNKHGVGIEAIKRMKERYEQNVTVEKIMNCEKNIDLKKTGNESETSQVTGANNHRSSPMPQHSTQERGSEESGKESASSLTGSEMISSSQGIKREDNLEAKASELLDESKNYTNSIEKLEKSDVRGEEYIESGHRAEDVLKDETHENCDPKPQRVPRVREKRSPNNQQCVDTESPTVVCEKSMGVEQQQNLSPGDKPDELKVNQKTTTSTTPRSEAVLSSEGLELSNEASFADRPAYSPVFANNRDDGDILEGGPAEVSKSSMRAVDNGPLSDSPSEECSAPVLNPSLEDTEKSGSDTHERVCEEKTSDFNKKSSEGQITCGLESASDSTSLSPEGIGNDDVTGESVLRYSEPCRNKSDTTPPSLSSILASALRTKQKRRPSFNSDHKQPVTEERNSGENNDVIKLPSEPVKVDGESKLLTQRVFEDTVTQNNETTSGVFSDVQNLSDELKQVTSGDSENDMPAGVEFLKTCFPDVDKDFMSSLFIANGCDVMKVVDELLANESDLPSFPADASKVTEQQSLASVVPTFPNSQILASQPRSSIEKPKSFRPADEMVSNVDAAHGINHQSPASCENAEKLGEMSPKVDRANQLRDLGPKPLSQPQSPSHRTFQLTLEPAVALHLIEMFGPFSGVNFQEEINDDDLIIDVDNSLARQLYKRWEKTVQARKGISVSKKVSPPRANRELTDPGARNFSGDQTSSASQRSSPRQSTGHQAETLREIMDEQLALELSRNTNVAEAGDQDIATKIKRQKLYDMFPGVDPVALEDVFQANRYELIPSVEAVKASCNLSGRQIPSTVMAPQFRSRVPNQEQMTRKESEEDWSWLYLDADSSRPKEDEGSFQTLESPTYLDYRAEAFQHYKQRDDCFKKAALAFSNKQGQLAQFYAQQGHLHTEKIKEANARAAALILEQKNELTDENTIDLHGLHVTEAIEALETMLCEKTDPHGSHSRKGCKAISVITGRGNNSRGGKARIKPAILEYLKKNNFRYTEPHPGLVKVHL